MQAGGCQAVHAGGRVFGGITQVDAAGGDEGHVGVDGLELRHQLRDLLRRHLIKLHAVDAGFHQAHRVFGARLDEQFLLADLRLELRQVGDEPLKPAVEGQVMIEDEHRLAQAQAMREGATQRERFDVEGLGAGHELAGGKHLAQRVHGMHGIHHLLGLGGKRAIVLEDVQADLPAHMQARRRAFNGHEHVARRKHGAAGKRFGHRAAEAAEDAGGLLGPAKQGRVARVVLHAARLPADAQDMRGQVDPAGDVGSDKLIEIAVRDIHMAPPCAS